MRSSRLLVAVLVSAVAASPAAAQIPTGARAGGGAVRAAPKMLVATPHVFGDRDSALAVQLGIGLRDRMDRNTGTTFTVIPRKQMNEALDLWGYPQDAILGSSVARQFALQLAARAYLTTAMTRTPDNRVAVTSRLVGISDDAGFVVKRTQEAGQSAEDFGKNLADDFKSVIKAYKNARECTDLSGTADKRDDAMKAAEKALNEQPNFGLAEYCLASIAEAQQAPPDTIISHLVKATEGDPLSLAAFRKLAGQYEALGDTNKVIASLQQMLIIEPTNQSLRETTIKVFNQYGRPKAAVNIADDYLRLDPVNTDIWDLKANAHAVAGEMPQALDALEHVYLYDSTGVDSTYFLKATVFANAAQDTAALLKWAEVGSARFPGSTSLLEQLGKAYIMAGNLDSAVAVTGRLVRQDSGQVGAALQLSKALAESRRVTDAFPFLDFVAAKGSDQDRLNSAAILTNGALPLLQQPQDLVGAADATRMAIQVAGTKSPQLTTTANYILGLATFFQVPALDKDAEAQKSCDIANQMDSLLKESESALALGKGTNPTETQKYQDYVKQYKPRIASMLQAYCDSGSRSRSRR